MNEAEKFAKKMQEKANKEQAKRLYDLHKKQKDAIRPIVFNHLEAGFNEDEVTIIVVELLKEAINGMSELQESLLIYQIDQIIAEYNGEEQ